MNSRSSPHRHELPSREVFALPRRSKPRHRPDNLRNIANAFDIPKRRKFYDIAHDLADDYYIDRVIEEDLLYSTQARAVFKRVIVNSSKLWPDIEEILSYRNRPLYSLWNEPYFTCTGELEDIALSFKRDEFADQVYCFMMLTLHALSKLPQLSPSRKKRLALRKWTAGHLAFWTNELGRPITSIHDAKDGYSPCHSFLRALLEEIDSDSLRALGTILREMRRNCGTN